MHQTNIASARLTYGKTPGTLSPEEVVRAHQQLVRRIAWQVHARMSTAIEIEDLMQIGMVALVEATRTFEERGIAFAPYAATRVRGAMIDELRRDARMARAGMARRRELATVRKQLENRLLRQASDAEMATEMGLDAAQYHSVVASTQAIRQESIDDVYSDHDPFFVDGNDDALRMLETAEQREVLAKCIAALGAREAMVLNLYFVEDMNLHEIGETLNVGAARVCQIKKSALQKIRGMLTRQDDV